MKKQSIFLAFSAILLLSGCGSNTNNSQESDSYGIDPNREKDQIVSFYLDYSHSEEPYFVYEWYSLIPMGECPEQCRLTSDDASDPLFPVFVCWSEYPSSIDDSHAWDFEKDSKGGVELKLYGIWASEE